jgi:MHS family proline/betaine transporter-like MFS transporter
MFHTPKKQLITVVAGMFGNILEWYDFALYGFMAVIISELFFASGNGVVSLLATYGVFAIGFLARPIGAWFFGYVGDVFGRKPALFLSVLLMGIATSCFGLLPTYATAGVWASVLLIILRLGQGLSVGGEFSTSVTYMVEQSPQKLRGFSGSFANIGSMTGMLLGAGAATLVTTLLSHDALLSWGWRIPFLFGGILAIIAIILWRHLPASVIHTKENRHSGKTPFGEAIANNKRELFVALAFSLGYAVLFYIALVYLPTYANKFLNMQLDRVLQINTLAIAISVLLIPLTGYLSDRLIRRKWFLMLAFEAAFLLAIPLFLALGNGTLAYFALVQLVLVLIVAIPLGVAPATYVELFPKTDRLTAYSLTFNISLGAFGGTAPLIATWLIQATGNLLMPAFYTMGAIVVATIGLLWMRDGSRKPLR